MLTQGCGTEEVSTPDQGVRCIKIKVGYSQGHCIRAGSIYLRFTSFERAQIAARRVALTAESLWLIPQL